MAVLLILAGVYFLQDGGSPPVTPAELAGEWEGTVRGDGREIHYVFHLVPTAGGLGGLLDSPDEGVAGIPVGTTQLSGLALHLEVPRLAGRFDGEVRKELASLEGHWIRAGARFPLVLTRR